MAAKLFVGNLSFQATEEDLRELFQQAGTVETVRIITDQFTGRPRGFGFVEMATKEEATKAVEMLNGRLFRDRNLVVDEARPQPQRGTGGPRGDRGPRPGGGGGGLAAIDSEGAFVPHPRRRGPRWPPPKPPPSNRIAPAEPAFERRCSSPLRRLLSALSISSVGQFQKRESCGSGVGMSSA